MCSKIEHDFDEEEDEFMCSTKEQYEIQLITDICKKCGKLSEKLYKLKFREAECEECFLAYVRHKFRATLGSSKVLPKNAQVLLLYDGSAESTMLLDMLHFAQTQNTFKRLHCNVKILVVDDFMLNGSVDTHKKQITELNDFLLNYETYERFIVPIVGENLLPQHINAYINDSTLASHKNMSNFKSSTSKQDYLDIKRKRLIIGAAEELDCQFVFLPDISFTLAMRLMTDVALGRGGNTALNVSLMDKSSNEHVALIRPIKDLTMAEVQLYIKAKNLQVLRKSEDVNVPVHSKQMSLQNLTRSFLNDLQENFPATVSTVYRTGDKITTNREQEESALEKCAFCLGNLDWTDSNTLLAIEFSRLTSQMGATLHNENDRLEQKALQNVLHGNTENWSHLCHGCRNIQNDFHNMQIIPEK